MSSAGEAEKVSDKAEIDIGIPHDASECGKVWYNVNHHRKTFGSPRKTKDLNTYNEEKGTEEGSTRTAKTYTPGSNSDDGVTHVRVSDKIR